MEYLHTNGSEIVNESGRPVRLRGTCVGGWLNLEDFINAYPGTESGIRKHMADALGDAKAALFFDCLADNFFAEADIEFIASTGANCVRLPLNYRRFENDDAPFEYVEAPFERLAKTLALCEKHGVYAILDLHAAQGWQNGHWHSDNERGAVMLWRHPHFQDRVAALWKELARRFKDCPAVAGYELLNEPNSGNPNGEHPFDFYANYKPDWPRLNALYRRLVSDIRAVDGRHIIFMEGDNYGRYFGGLEAPFAENLVYSSHNYTQPGFGPGEYPGLYGSPAGPVYWDKHRHRLEFDKHEGIAFARKHNVPLLVGEFGSQYHGGAEDAAHRLASMRDQLAVYNEAGVSWTTWTYKDAGVMGWVTLNPMSDYMRVVAPIQAQKRRLGAENFVAQLRECPGRDKSRELAEIILQGAMNPLLTLNDTHYTFNYAALTGFAAAMLQPAYAARFNGMNEDDLRRLAGAFALERCVVNEPYREALAEACR